jgi:tetratricopeptide (TPR) repeat protein
VLVPLPPRMLTSVLRDLSVRVVASLGEYVSAALLPMAPTSLRGHVAFAADGSLSPSRVSLAVGVLSLGFAAWLVHRAWRAPHARPYAADIAWFFLPLLPVLNILPLRLESLVAERFMHLASVGIAAVLARAMLLFCQRQARGVRIGVAACIALTLVFALVSVPRVFAFANDSALWRYEYRRNPKESYVLYRLANEALIAGATEEAIYISREGYLAAHEARSQAYEVRFVLLMAQAVLRMTPDSEQQALRNLRDFYDALAKNELATLMLPTFKVHVRFGRELAPVVSSDALLFALPRAHAHARTGDLERAIVLLRESVQVAAARPETWHLLATLLERTGRSAEAREALREANALGSDGMTFRLRSASASTR